MKLTPRRKLVKLDPTVLRAAILTSAVTTLAVLVLLAFTDRQRQHMDRFGAAAAAALAELAVEPLMRQDRLHLGVIGNRLVQTSEIRAVASYSAAEEVLASTGELSGPQYTAPVVIDDTIVGYVRVALRPNAFATDEAGRAWSLLLIALLAPPLVAFGWAMAAGLQSGQLALPRAVVRRGSRTSAGGEAEAATAEQEPVADAPHYLLAVNLYNQLSLHAHEREFERTLCLELAEAVAGIYHGHAQALPGVGVLVDFDQGPEDDRPWRAEDDRPCGAEDDRPFAVLCAAFLLARMLREEAPFGRYRLGINMVMERGVREPMPEEDAVADAALLSALAKDGGVAVSETFAGSLGGIHRCHTRPLVNPLLDELTTSGPECHLISGLAPPFDGLLAEQAERLRAQRDATSSPSTF